MQRTNIVSCTDLKQGDTVIIHGAVFKIASTQMLKETPGDTSPDAPEYMSAVGIWQAGEEIKGLFGKDKLEFNIVGNKHYKVQIKER